MRRGCDRTCCASRCRRLCATLTRSSTRPRGSSRGAHGRHMLPADAIAVLTLAFIVGMVWLRTRMHYPRRRAKLSLTRAGRIYFAVLLAVLVLGLLLAPAAGRAL